MLPRETNMHRLTGEDVARITEGEKVSELISEIIITTSNGQ